MQSESNRRSFKKLFFLGLMLVATAFAVAGQWEPSALARPCCSSCPPNDLENHCWDVCAFSC